MSSHGHEWLTVPATERELTKPEWWGVSLGGLAYGVKALTADEALDKAIAAQRERFGSSFPFSFVELHGEESQPEFDERYPDQDVVILIPFSMVEYPEDPTQMTDEQREAFDRLKQEK